MLAARAHWARSAEPWAPHAIAITSPGSALDREAAPWLARFPLWDWVGGRTSITGPVGLVPMALCGHDWPGFLEGARLADAWTRAPAPENPAAQLALAWHAAGRGRGDRALVVLPYRDRLALLGRYLQQLVMESLGKERDRTGEIVHQGMTVYGNKGSTDQHAFVQQLRDGRDDALVLFVETIAQGSAPDVGHAASDALVGMLRGTRQALRDAGRPSVTLTAADASARSLGAIVALFERAVGLYAELIDVNAYHQPGVEAGKTAARGALELLGQLGHRLGTLPATAGELAAAADPLLAWRLLHHLAATDRAACEPGATPAEDLFRRA
jgi:glucose-6-phosphate isomerase